MPRFAFGDLVRKPNTTRPLVVLSSRVKDGMEEVRVMAAADRHPWWCKAGDLSRHDTTRDDERNRLLRLCARLARTLDYPVIHSDEEDKSVLEIITPEGGSRWSLHATDTTSWDELPSYAASSDNGPGEPLSDLAEPNEMTDDAPLATGEPEVPAATSPPDDNQAMENSTDVPPEPVAVAPDHATHPQEAASQEAAGGPPEAPPAPPEDSTVEPPPPAAPAAPAPTADTVAWLDRQFGSDVRVALEYLAKAGRISTTIPQAQRVKTALEAQSIGYEYRVTGQHIAELSVALPITLRPPAS